MSKEDQSSNDELIFKKEQDIINTANCNQLCLTKEYMFFSQLNMQLELNNQNVTQ